MKGLKIVENIQKFLPLLNTFFQEKSRITSYNVCYTKLLRCENSHLSHLPCLWNIPYQFCDSPLSKISQSLPEKMYLTTEEISEYFQQFSTLSFMNPIHDEVIHSTNFNSITHLKLAKAKQELLPQIKQLMKGKRRVIFVGDNKAFIDRVSHRNNFV